VVVVDLKALFKFCEENFPPPEDAFWDRRAEDGLSIPEIIKRFGFYL